jgi:hypothetical protein
MSSTSNSFVWLEEKQEPRTGDVVYIFEDGKRLSVRPVGGCKTCNGRGRYGTISPEGNASEVICKCVDLLAHTQANLAKAKTVKTVSLAYVDRVEQDAIKRLTEEMGVIRSEFDGLMALALKRADGLEAKSTDAVALAVTAEASVTEAKAKLEQLEAERQPMLDQMEVLRKALSLSADLLDVARNVIVCKTQDSKMLRRNADEYRANAAVLRGGDYGARAAKLSEAIAKREAAITRLRSKMTPPAAPVAPEPTKAADAPAAG